MSAIGGKTDIEWLAARRARRWPFPSPRPAIIHECLGLPLFFFARFTLRSGPFLLLFHLPPPIAVKP
jgi:hypothetical protein